MNKKDIRKAIDELIPDGGMERRLSEKIMKGHKHKSSFKPVIAVAVCFTLVCAAVLGYSEVNRRQGKSPNALERVKNSSGNLAKTGEGIYLPKIELPNNVGVEADMIGLIVYKGRVYTQTGTTISAEDGKNMLGEKLGTTKGNINEWSSQDDYAIEFASTIGKADVYSVNGYDEEFRIMVYNEAGVDSYATFYECINGIIVKNGADIFDKLKIEAKIKSAKYQHFESWNYNKQQFREFTEFDRLNNFLVELRSAVPYPQEELSYLWDNEEGENQMFIYITLEDGSEVELRLFKEGYVYYYSSHIFFKVEKQDFDKLWEVLQ